MTQGDVILARKMAATHTYAEITEFFRAEGKDYSESTVRSAITGRTWGNLPGATRAQKPANTKLAAQDIADIHARMQTPSEIKRTAQELVAKYGVSMGTIYAIKNRTGVYGRILDAHCRKFE
jgi:hypothetical protein